MKKTLNIKFNRTDIIAVSIIVIAIIIYALLYLKLHKDWWFDDDPSLYALVHKANSIFDFFINKEFITIGSQNEIVPMLLLSITIDNLIQYGNPLVAYVHQIISLLIVVLLLYFVLRRYSGLFSYSITASLGWLVIPSTQVVVEFLSARSYIEGLAFSLLSLLYLYPMVKFRKIKTHQITFTLGLLICSMLYKEYFVSITFSFIFLVYFARKFWLGAGICTVIAVCYTSYRAWAIGINIHYGVPFPGITDYLKSLLGISYIFSGSAFGYILVPALIGLMIFAVVKKLISRELFLLFISLLIVSLLTIYPLSLNIVSQYRAHGTWYRSPFIVNTIIWIFGLYALWKIIVNQKIRIILSILIILTIIPGSWKTKEKWDYSKALHREEGLFFINNSRDKLMYSKAPAWWFLIGVQYLYPTKSSSSYILEEETKKGNKPIVKPDDIPLHKFQTIWRFNGENMIEDNFLFYNLLNKY